MLIIIKTKDTDNIIGLKEDLATRLEDLVEIEHIDVRDEKEGNKHEQENRIDHSEGTCQGYS